LLDDVVSELGHHVRSEDELFYPAVGEVTALLAISQKMLAATLHHDAGEGTPHVPQSHALGEEALESLGTQMEQRKRQLENSTVTQTLRKAKREVLRRV